MKAKIFILVFGIFFSLCIFSQTPDEKIGALINQRDFFELSSQYPLLKDSLNPAIGYLAKALLEDALNKQEEACETIDYLSQNLQNELGLENILGMIVLQSNNLLKLGRYEESYNRLNDLLNQETVKTYASPQILATLEVMRRKSEALKDYPPSEIIRSNEDCVVPMKKEEGDWFSKIDVEINGKVASFIFDTGADCPGFVSLDFAKKHEIRILGDSILTGGVTHSDYTQIGFADSLKIGNITYKNVWFLVAENVEIACKDSIITRIDAVLGRHFMEKLGDICVYPKESIIVFPHQQSEILSSENNMLLINGQPYIKAMSNKEKLSLHFDTGGDIGLSANYFIKHKNEIESSLKKETKCTGGFAGSKQVDVYKLPVLPLAVSGVDCELTDIGIITENMLIGDDGDGSMGMDFINKFDKVTFNFKKMFLKIVKND
jgi:hypothetical protein